MKGRKFDCCHCGHKFFGKGMMRVCRKIVFVFCLSCWTGNRSACEEQMRVVAA